MISRTVYLADLRADQRDWSKYEMALFHRAVSHLWEAGLSVEADGGMTDEGDPWFVFCDPDSGDVLAHFARIGGSYVVSAPGLIGSLNGRRLADLVERFLQRRVAGARVPAMSRSTPAA